MTRTTRTSRAPRETGSPCSPRWKRRCCGSSSWTIHNANHLRAEPRRAEGRRPPGLVRLARHHHDGALLRRAAAAGPGRGQAACQPGLPRHPVPARPARRREKLENFRGFKGAQSYPSRTKDGDDVDFSTGSVGLGVAQTLFASLVQDYVRAHGWMTDRPEGRMIALVGDAELDEGNIYEALLEGWKHGVRNTWWIVDYNRQSLDAVVREGLWEKFETMFAQLRLGRRDPEIRPAAAGRLRRAGRRDAAAWIDACPNQLYSALTFQGGAAWRTRLLDEIGDQGPVTRLIEQRSDAELAALMTNLGGHDLRDAARGLRGASTTTGRSASSPTRSRASACRSPATRTTTPA